MAETDAAAPIRVAVDHTGRALRLSGDDRKRLRDQLSDIGVRFRLRGEEGAVVADAWEGVGLLASDLVLDWSPGRVPTRHQSGRRRSRGSSRRSGLRRHPRRGPGPRPVSDRRRHDDRHPR